MFYKALVVIEVMLSVDDTYSTNMSNSHPIKTIQMIRTSVFGNHEEKRNTFENVKGGKKIRNNHLFSRR